MSDRRLPSVDSLAATLVDRLPRALAVEVARRSIDLARASLARGEDGDAGKLAELELRQIGLQLPRRVVNATGVILHTNLGRAPLGESAVQALGESAQGYSNLELDLATGRRGGRGAHVERLLRALTGADAALVVNNNAGALFLALTALARDREVPVSRGELIEIGGSFRLPELMTASGAHLVEVGTTNRTRLEDYRAAIGEDTALLLKVHPSNYRIEGFSESVAVDELVRLGRRSGLPLAVDAGSGLLDERVPWMAGAPPGWLGDEPGVRQLLEDGADLVLFSGDKLLGGPQAGIVVGKADLVSRMATHPVARALRCDGPRMAALGATLSLYADGQGASLPFWTAVSIPYDKLEVRAKSVLAESGVAGEVRRGESVAGAGSLPGAAVPSPILVVESGGRVDAIWRRLLGSEPPVVARRDAGALLLDLRAVDPPDDSSVAASLRAACRS